MEDQVSDLVADYDDLEWKPDELASFRALLAEHALLTAKLSADEGEALGPRGRGVRAGFFDERHVRGGRQEETINAVSRAHPVRPRRACRRDGGLAEVSVVRPDLGDRSGRRLLAAAHRW